MIPFAYRTHRRVNIGSVSGHCDRATGRHSVDSFSGTRLTASTLCDDEVAALAVRSMQFDALRNIQRISASVANVN